MKKVLIIVFSIIAVCAVVGVSAYFIFRDNSKELTLSVEDCEVSVGGYSKIGYSCSERDASISFTTISSEIATVELVDHEWKVFGVSSGETKLIAVATYKDFRCRKTATVKVVGGDVDDGNTETGSGEEESLADKSGKTGDETQKIAPTISINLTKVMNCEIDNDLKKIAISSGKTAIFSVILETSGNSSGEMEITSHSADGSGLTFDRSKVMPQAYELTASTAGSWTITFVINDAYTKSYTVECK